MSSSRQAVLVAFLLGCLIGVLAGARYARAFRRGWRGPDAERALKRLTRDLDLDPGQQQAVKTILVEQRDKIVSLHEQCADQLKQLHVSFRSELQPQLKPEQQSKLQALIDRWDRKHADQDKD